MIISKLRIFAVMAKEFTQLHRDRVTYAMILVIPIMQLLLYGYAINMDPHHLPAAVFSNDKSTLANTIISAIEQTSYVDVKYLPTSEAELDRLMRLGKVMLTITIPPDFTQRVLKHDNAQILVEADASDPQSAGNALAAISALSETVLANELRGPVGNYKTQKPFDVVVHRKFNPENISSYNIVPGMLGVVLTMTLVMMTALAVTRETERGTMESLLSTPAMPLEIMIGKLTPYIIVGIIQVSVILILGRILFGVPMAKSLAGWFALSIGAALFIIGNLGLGYFISTLARNQLQAMQLSVFVFLPSIFLSGFMFPFYGLPGWARFIGNLLPITHFLRVVRGTLLKGQILSDMGTSLACLSIIVVVILTITVVRSRTTLD
ncbi:MAG: ABC transporter permease [Planctomycetaceae bacterium]|nr:ABC transporter permease [Planctomycetaceae bacterium]